MKAVNGTTYQTEQDEVSYKDEKDEPWSMCPVNCFVFFHIYESNNRLTANH